MVIKWHFLTSSKYLKAHNPTPTSKIQERQRSSARDLERLKTDCHKEYLGWYWRLYYPIIWLFP